MQHGAAQPPCQSCARNLLFCSASPCSTSYMRSDCVHLRGTWSGVPRGFLRQLTYLYQTLRTSGIPIDSKLLTGVQCDHLTLL